MNNETEFEQIYPLILQENLSGALDLLEAIPEDRLSEEQRQLKGKFQQRFRTHSEKFEPKISDTLANRVAADFRAYWDVVLPNVDALEQADAELEKTMIDLLFESGYLGRETAREEVAQDLYAQVNAFLSSTGLYANAMGKTGSFYDLFLWTEQTEKVYAVHLPETDTEVKVVFMDGFASNGWAYYATFGKYYAAGWAKADALYCVTEAYDQSSETFTTSYLAHEAQHLVDYESFPQLKQADLEYRAKLAELSTAKTILPELIHKLAVRSKNDRKIAHPFANFCVVRDLSRAVFGQEFVEGVDQWAGISAQKINETSVRLLKEHTANLQALGAESVTAFIR